LPASYNNASRTYRWAKIVMVRGFPLLLAAALFAGGTAPSGAEELRAGFAAVEITPRLDAGKSVYLAGYGMNRKATGVHDPLFARAVVLASGKQRIALVSVDLVGLQYPTVKQVRQGLPGFDYILVASTHNHEAPDVIGIWGRGPFHRGVDESYLEWVAGQIVRAVEQAAADLTPCTATYGTAEDESLLGDSRLPIVKDGVLRVVKLARAGSEQPLGLIVQWNCHPEALGSKNTLITADFPASTVASLEKKYSCRVVYFSGAVGGLMGLPKDRIFDDAGRPLGEGSFEFARRYGEAVAALADKAVAGAQPLTLSPFVISARPITVPVQNALYRAARALGVLKREGLVWTGDSHTAGEPMTSNEAGRESAVESEVAYLRLGELHVACLPGEIYPELVYGKFQEPADPGADFPNAPLEPTVAGLMPGPKWLLLGLANDELGYVIPKRQWDKEPPFAYGLDGQYGEINSCGPEVAPILMEALQRRVAEATGR
jgi:hypothetical protein